MYPMSVKKVPKYPIFYPKGTVKPVVINSSVSKQI